MKCQEANELLIPYLNNEVTRSERELLQAHLAQCEPCWQTLSALSAAQQRLRTGLAETARHAEVPAQAWLRLRKAIRSNPQPRLAFRLPVLSSLGALLVTGLAALLVTAPLGAPANFAPVVHDASTLYTAAPAPTVSESKILPTASIALQPLPANVESQSPSPAMQKDWFEGADLSSDDSLERITSAEPESHAMPMRKAENRACRCVQAL